jgi:hypothetical protein
VEKPRTSFFLMISAKSIDVVVLFVGLFEHFSLIDEYLGILVGEHIDYVLQVV